MASLERDFRQNAVIVEAERRWKIAGHDGAARLTGFRNRGRFARFDEALARASATGTAPDLAAVRRPQQRLGIAFNAEQEVT
ncbi:hypothetical protein ABTN09_20875, partial [Acinetobacter baumannii]